MKKRVVSMILAATMVLSMSACGNENSQAESKTTSNSTSGSVAVSESVSSGAKQEEYVPSYPICEDPITITAIGQTGGTCYDWSDTVQYQEMEKRLGIKIDTEMVYDSASWAVNRNLLFASDELPDLMMNTGLALDQVNQYGRDGYLLDFSQYLDVMPNFVALMEEYPEWADFLRGENGEIYGLFRINRRPDYTFRGWQVINKQWLDNLNLEEPKTLEDFYDVLKAFKEQDANGNGDPNDEIPMMGVAGSEMASTILGGFGIYTNTHCMIRQVDENGKIYLADTTDNYREYLKYMNKLYEEGLMNEDWYVITFGEANALAEEGKVGVIGNHSLLVMNTNAEGDDWIAMNNLTSEEYPERTVVLNPRITSTAAVVVSADTKYPEEIAKLIDYCYSDEGILAAAYGYEGITFDWTEVAGIRLPDHSNDSAGYETNEMYKAKKAVSGTLGLALTGEGTIYNAIEEIPTEELLVGEVWEQGVIHALRAVAHREEGLVVKECFPSLVFTSAEASAWSPINVDINSYCGAAQAQFITGELDPDSDEDWNAYLNQLKDLKLDTMLQIEQQAYDRKYSK